MSELLKSLMASLFSEWAGVPIIIWLFGFLCVAIIAVALTIIRVRNIHIFWKSKKREFLLKTDNRKGEDSKDQKALMQTVVLATIETFRDLPHQKSIEQISSSETPSDIQFGTAKGKK